MKPTLLFVYFCASSSERIMQEALDKAFAALQLEEALELQQQELSQSLTKAEQCFLQRTGAMINIEDSAVCDRAWEAANTSAVLNDVSQIRSSSDPPYYQMPTKMDLAQSCWLSSGRKLVPGVASSSDACIPTPESLRIRRGIISQYPSLRNHSGTLGRLLVEHNQRVVFFGHSVHTHAFHAARCEMLRTVPEALPRIQHEAASAGHRGNGGLNAVELLSRRLQSWKASGKGGIVMASLGMNYNNRQDLQGRDQASFSNQNRLDFAVHLAALFPVLEEFSANCSRCIAMFATSHLQHFELTADGAFSPELTHPSVNMSNYGCGPAKASFDSLSSSSPNHWRSADAAALAPKYPHVLMVPMHLVNGHAWTAHPGWAGTTRFVSHKDGVHRKLTLDCTHYCYTPLLYEPLWLALEIPLKVQEGRV
jgi:hypothetical protein